MVEPTRCSERYRNCLSVIYMYTQSPVVRSLPWSDEVAVEFFSKILAVTWHQNNFSRTSWKLPIRKFAYIFLNLFQRLPIIFTELLRHLLENLRKFLSIISNISENFWKFLRHYRITLLKFTRDSYKITWKFFSNFRECFEGFCNVCIFFFLMYCLITAKFFSIFSKNRLKLKFLHGYSSLPLFTILYAFSYSPPF